MKTNFDKLFILEIANNHMGDLKHGIRIIREFGKVAGKFDFRFGFKLQYRDLDSFIHPKYKGSVDIKYVKRFEETRLDQKQLKALRDEIKNNGFLALCTPFDEPSVDLLEKHDFDIIKVGSCSFDDWPLLERIVKTDKPLILSCAGVLLENMDKVVAFLEHRKKEFCLMHCVGEYPANKENLQLNQIDLIRNRYPNIAVGYSTHEDPNNFDAIKIAIAKGASVFERHIGLETSQHKLNKYSSGPEQIEQWLKNAQEAFTICGFADKTRHISEKEKEGLRGLKRGVFAKGPIKKGKKINPSDIFLAIPNVKNQLLANDLSKYSEFYPIKGIKANEPVLAPNLKKVNLRGKFMNILNKVKVILIESKTSIPDKIDFELSHHYGINNFEKHGAAIINCINREYCKKLIIMLPGQKHPVHYHKKKEETFHILYGDITLNLGGLEKEYRPGEMVIIERGKKHSFSSKTGAIFEEVSTTHHLEDSFYDDKKILKNKNRKTEMTFWYDCLIKPIV